MEISFAEQLLDKCDHVILFNIAAVVSIKLLEHLFSDFIIHVRFTQLSHGGFDVTGELLLVEHAVLVSVIVDPDLVNDGVDGFILSRSWSWRRSLDNRYWSTDGLRS